MWSLQAPFEESDDAFGGKLVDLAVSRYCGLDAIDTDLAVAAALRPDGCGSMVLGQTVEPFLQFLAFHNNNLRLFT